MTSPRKTCLRAAFVAPMSGPILRDAGVVAQGGVIVDVGAFDQMRAAHPDADVTDLGGVVLLAGLVNAHAHLELSNAACGESPGGSFTDWIMSVRARSQIDPATRERDVSSAVRAGAAQCVRFGVTCVGDITNHADVTRPALRDTPLRVVSYGEVLGLGKLRTRFDEMLTRAFDDTHAGDRLRIGLSPHAPYTVDLPGYRQCVAIARGRNLPLATHLAETPDELSFLTQQSGAFREVWDAIQSWADPVETFRDGGPIDFAAAIGLLDMPALLAHVNYCDDREMALIARPRAASVVYCPRTHRYFGHPPHRWREMLDAGINVAVGTDSCASSPDLNLVDDLRLMHEIAPDVPVETLWKLATIRAAGAVGMQHRVGSIERGKRADLVAFPARTDHPLRWILEQRDALPVGVWIDGDPVKARV